MRTVAIYRSRVGRWYPCPDSNRGTRFRKPLLYPPELQGRIRVIVHLIVHL